MEGVDYMLISPFDLSTDLGVSGRLDAPELLDAISHAERAILEAKVLGGAALTSDQTKALLERGYRILAHGFDVLIIKQFIRQAADWRRV